MTKADLLALAARCEAAQGADRELDAEIAVAVGWTVDGEFGHAPGREHLLSRRIPAYTSSLDAAASLVPAGLGWLVGVDDDTPTACVFPPHGHQEWLAADTPALALSAAALRAIAAGMEEG